MNREHPTGTERKSLNYECGWKGGDRGGLAERKMKEITARAEKTLDRDQPSHGRSNFPSAARPGESSPLALDSLAEDSMDIRSAIKREERKLERELTKIQDQLSSVRAAAKALGYSANKKVTGATKRVLSEAARSKISRAAKKRWAKFRAQAKKAIG